MREWPWFLIAEREYLQRVRSRSFLAATFLGPVILGLILIVPSGLAPGRGDQNYTLGVQDSTGTIVTILTEELMEAEALRGDRRRISLVEVPPRLRREDVAAWVQSGDMDAVLVVWGSALHEEVGELLTSYTLDDLAVSHLETTISRAVLKSRAHRFGLGPELLHEITRPSRVRLVRMDLSTKLDPRSMFTIAMFMAMLLYTTLIVYGMATMRAVIEEKSGRIVEVLLASVKPVDLLTGKILGVASVGLTQYTIWILMAGLASVSCSGDPQALHWAAGTLLQNLQVELLVALVCYFVLGYFLYSCLYAVAGSLTSQPSDAQHLQLPITLTLLIPIVLIPLALGTPDAPLIRALSLVPFFASILMFCRISSSSPPFGEVVLSAMFLIMTIGVCWWLAARVYRVAILLQGKPVTLREVARWMHQD